MKRFVCFLFCLVLLFSLGAAAFAENYTYTVRVYAGNRGELKVGDGNVYTVKRAYGEEFSFEAQDQVKLPKDSKYYVKGIRESGRDNKTVDRPTFTVTRDVDFVVAYGVKSGLVSYTIHFVEYKTNKVLHDPITFYGNKGDKPVASYRYIEGYTPRYRNITGTLGAEGTNKWTLEYVKNDVGTTGQGGTGQNHGGTGQNQGGSQTQNDSRTQTTGQNQGGAAVLDGNGEPVTADAQETLPDLTQEDSQEVIDEVLRNGPEEVLDLDEAEEEYVDEEDPEAESDVPEGEEDAEAQGPEVNNRKTLIGIAIASAAVVVIAALITYFVTRNKRDLEDED